MKLSTTIHLAYNIYTVLCAVNLTIMILKFGKHKGKSIEELINEGEYDYIVWLEENVDSVSVDKKTYKYCKNEVFIDKITHEAIMESEHGDWGCRD